MLMRPAIPHLARSIIDKHSSQTWRFACIQELSRQTRLQSSSRIRPLKERPSPSVPKPTKSDRNLPAYSVKLENPREAKRVSTFFKATAGFGFAIGIYITYTYTSWSRSVISHANSDNYLPFNADVSSRWKELGRDFDDEVELSEKLMLMKRKRRNIARQAYGNVLEVSVGTGRNLEHYDLQPFDPTRGTRRNIITNLTLNDQSGVIIAAAEKKLENVMSRQTKQPTAKVDFVVGDAGVSGVIERPEGGYDTIIQTMGVCSMVDPVGFLKRMGQLCRQPGEKSRTPEKWRATEDDGKGGQILLLEHGRGHFDWLNRILDTGASLHAHHYGCWWNKDIDQIVKQSGLEIEDIKRYHGGTTWRIILRPKTLPDSTDIALHDDNIQIIPKRQFGLRDQK